MMRLRSVILGGMLLLAQMVVAADEPWREPVTGMEFAAIPKGCFRMGSPPGAFNEEDRIFQQRLRTEMPEHEVCVDAFWIGRYEVREAEWQKVMGRAHSGRAENAPVAGVTWEEASNFARQLSELSGGAQHFRLPTEAEWEFACRAGEPALTNMFGRSNLNSIAWYSTSDGFDYSGLRHKDVQPAGGKQPNGYGLHDMLGNVWEWVQDGYAPDAYAHHALYNPLAPETGEKHVIRGGGLRSNARMVRCETRAWYAGEPIQDTLGLRLVRDR